MRRVIPKAVAGLFFLAAAAASAQDGTPPIMHRFLAMDESRHSLHFIDENTPSNNWRILLPGRYRDFQLIGNNRLLVSTNAGYAEYDLGSHQLVKEVKDTCYAGSETACRLKDGHTIIGCNQNEKGMVFYELDAGDKLLNTLSFPELKVLRTMRLSPRGTLLFGANKNHIMEVDRKGAVVRDLTIPEGMHIFQVVEKPDGHLMVALGYGQLLLELDNAGKEVKRFGGKPGPEGLGFHFFAGFHLLKNGHILQSNWTGHGPQDSEKGVQIVQFDPSGQIVWKWHHPELAGSIHGVIALDEDDPQSPPNEHP